MTNLDELIKQAQAKLDAMTPKEKEAMYKAQRESWVRAEMNWPKPKFKWIRGVKVYDSYEDYIND